MCLIIKNLDGKPIPFSVIRAAVKNNKDGYGRLDLPSGKVRKTLDMQEALKMAMEPGPAVHHFRLGTAGGKTIENVHPFEITKNWLLFHNGTVPSFNGKTKSDSHNLANFLRGMNRKYWQEAFELFDGSRFLAIHRRTGEFIKTGDQWTEKDGIWYSNGYHFRSDTLVGVYGNLSEGAVLNKELLKKVDFVDRGETDVKHRLCYIGEMPFLLEGDGSSSGESRGDFLEMDIYEVNENTLEKLDLLHHHPGFYTRKLIQFETFKEGTVFAWVYFCTDERMDSGKYYFWEKKKKDDDKKDANTNTTLTVVETYEDDEFGGRWTPFGYTGPDSKPKGKWDKDDFVSVVDVLEADDEEDPPFETYEMDPDQVFSDREITELAGVNLFLMKEENDAGHRFCDQEGKTYADEWVAHFLEKTTTKIPDTRNFTD